ncbi:MAG: MYXO-CTERM sorting domain-containing protein [Myxococcota bacterium]
MILSLLVSPALACGPIFPFTILTQGEEGLMSAPLTDFSVEVRRIVADDRSLPRFVSVTTQRASAADLKAAGVAPPLIAAVVEMRSKQSAYRPQPVSLGDIPDGLPTEFDLYLRGAVHWSNGDARRAKKAWQSVLKLPPEQRTYRSTWAAYMLGRSEVQGDNAALKAWMSQVRALAAEGFVDSLGLAAETYGWEAYAQLQADDLGAAAKGYVQQLQTGAPGAARSLQIVARRALQQPNLYAVAQDPLLNPLVTADLVSRSGDEAETARWLEVVTEFGGGRISGADRLAWAAYQSGDMAAAKGWLEQAEDTPIATWIDARLKMRDGDYEAAAALLKTVGEGFGEESWENAAWWSRRVEYETLRPGHTALAERGALLVHEGRYEEALEALLAAQHWVDAAYVAERLMPLDALQAYVDRTTSASDKPEGNARETEPKAALRDLLGRRLVRAGQLDEAAPYLFPDRQPQLEAYQTAIADSKRGAALDRAKALWSAARTLRKHGMALMGTELSPDYAYTDGYYSAPAVGWVRHEFVEGTFAPNDAERAQYAAQAPEPDQRFHYRYVAAELAWQAAALLPDDDEGTLKILCQAGIWLKNKDPQAADRYYKAMVNRGWNTTLGNSANALRWFPEPSQCAMEDLILDNPDAMKGCAAVTAPATGWLAFGGVLLGWTRRRGRLCRPKVDIIRPWNGLFGEDRARAGIIGAAGQTKTGDP